MLIKGEELPLKFGDPLTYNLSENDEIIVP